ncbi:YbaB/EbfC family nucleoid-associated protein [Actinomadura sp. 7K534]|uniref:YbaB/EbfC family nucleoid-associated protein n=1 Tax=Actinomadura sp. 7K534 TaxID=2530366 RepID=UPI0010494404|nr:YbaB/EbfC family nucleoid-associated protein [Actinomadura sp. 7K534]TDB94275.1 YbaB/EbfC family DNA-binding protein [Actinomadura sp. 7K534]
MDAEPPYKSRRERVLAEPDGNATPAVAPAALCAEGQSRDGLIRVTVSHEGRIDELAIDPQALRAGPRRDAAGLAEEIKHAVNAAIDRLHERIREDTEGIFGGDLNLHKTAERFEATLERLTGDIAEAHRKFQP